MAHTYLLDLYEEIENRLVTARAAVGEDGLDNEMARGRMEFLQEFKLFLAERYNSKLPRRIRSNYIGST